MIVLTGGFGLWLLVIPLFEWFRPGGNAYFFLGTLLIFGPISLPFLLIAYSVLERAYASTVEVVAAVAGIIGFGLCGDLLRRTGLQHWKMETDAADGWRMVLEIIPLIVTGLLPLAIGIIAYRLCRWLGFRYGAPERLNRQYRAS